ncbi:MAG: WYL domain-containing protein [Clostridiales bacterium]|nr:WYL domain-containing protein [Candidatus Blautia equi]
MAKGNNQKLKLLFLAKILKEKTDEEHGISVQEMITLLNEYEVNADRKTIYLDLEELRHFGMEIVSEQDGRNVYYRLLSKDFELPELKLLVDAVQGSKFITERKSRDLIKKLESLVSVYEARQLHRQVVLSGRVKTMNESIYYSVDKIHSAINQDRQIKFRYFQWNVKKEEEFRHDGAWYYISPWALVWDDENYYLIGFDGESGIMKHYRVDKMKNLEVSKEKREGKEIFQEMNLPRYSKGLFGMYGGEEVSVTLLCENYLAGTIIDRFGKDIMLIPVDEGHFRTHVQVIASGPFLGWIIALGKGVRIIGPESVVEAMQTEIRRLAEQYL